MKYNDKRVFMTVLTNDKYIPGVKALKRSLKLVRSKHDLVILVPQSMEISLRSKLKRNRILDKHCKMVVKKDVIVEYPKEIHFKDHYWFNTFFKLSVASCEEFDKILLLDSDMLITNNIDHLFEKPDYSAVVAGHCAVPEWVKLNSGLMVIEPRIKLYNTLMDSIKPAMYRRFNEGYNIGDQDVFQEAYKDWEKHEELQLPERYNCFFSDVRVLVNKEGINFKDISVIHFIGENKPWSNGCFTKKNIRQCLSFLRHGKFYELKILVKYLLLAAM